MRTDVDDSKTGGLFAVVERKTQRKGQKKNSQNLVLVLVSLVRQSCKVLFLLLVGLGNETYATNQAGK